MFFYKIVLGFLGLLHFHKNFGITLPVSITEILIGIALIIGSYLKCLETFLVVSSKRCYWNPVGRGQRSY